MILLIRNRYSVFVFLFDISIIFLCFFVLFINTRPQDFWGGKFAINKIPPLPEEIMIKVYDHDADAVVPMDLEEYIVGVVAAEMPVSFDYEALKAQAVAARTYTYNKYQSGGCNRGADICTDSSHCQAFATSGECMKKWGDSYNNNYAKIYNAVYETAGQILVYDSKPILALFHSTSGGSTENVENVYSKYLPYLRSVESPGEERSPKYKTVFTFSFSEFVNKIKQADKNAKLTVSIIKKSIKQPVINNAGRVDNIEIGGVKFTGSQLRKIFGLTSTKFNLDISDDKVIFTCYGYGHGVGLSQFGADAMAKSGAKYTDILLHYYTGVEIFQLYQHQN